MADIAAYYSQAPLTTAAQMNHAYPRSLAAAAALASSGAVAADVEAGKKKVQEVCAACHGIDGAQPTTPEYPKLAGQYPDYLAKALRDYKSGRARTRSWRAWRKPLTEKDIENISVYFYAQPSNLASKY